MKREMSNQCLPNLLTAAIRDTRGYTNHTFFYFLETKMLHHGQMRKHMIRAKPLHALRPYKSCGRLLV